MANTSVLHPDYDFMTLENDVGLIYLDEPVLLSGKINISIFITIIFFVYLDYISTIFLPNTDLQPDAEVIAIGWGQVDDCKNKL